MNFDAVFFDLDGTLVNSLEDLANSVNYILDKEGYPTHSVETYRSFIGDGIVKLIERAVPDVHKSNDKVLKLKDKFMDYYSEHYVDKTVAYDGLTELVSHLKEKGLKLAVVTNKSQNMAEKIVHKLFGNSFDYILGLREGIPAKPDPTGILMAINGLDTIPSKCAFVGDSGMDIVASLNSGTYPIGVLWGYREKDELARLGAKAFASNADELLAIILSE